MPSLRYAEVRWVSTVRRLAAITAGRGDEQLPMAGQSVGLVHDVLPAAQIVRQVLVEAEAALAGARARALAGLEVPPSGRR